MIQDNIGGGAMGSTSPSSQSGGIKQELAGDARTIGKAAQDKLGTKANEGKEQATQAARSTSSALNKAAEQMRQDESTPAWLTSTLETASREIDRLAGSLEGKDTKAIGQDITAFARRSPIAFLAAAAVAGFAAARVLRAGSDFQEHGHEGGEQPGAQHADAPGVVSSASADSSERSSFDWGNKGAQSGSSLERAGQ